MSEEKVSEEIRKGAYGWQGRRTAAKLIGRIRPDDLGTLYAALGMAKEWAEQNIMLGSTVADEPETGYRAHLERFEELGQRLSPAPDAERN